MSWDKDDARASVRLQRVLTRAHTAHMTPAQMHKAVDKLPGEDGWFHEGNGAVYRELADLLVGSGWSPVQAVVILSRAYGAAAGEFGS